MSRFSVFRNHVSLRRSRFRSSSARARCTSASERSYSESVTCVISGVNHDENFFHRRKCLESKPDSIWIVVKLFWFSGPNVVKSVVLTWLGLSVYSIRTLERMRYNSIVDGDRPNLLLLPDPSLCVRLV